MARPLDLLELDEGIDGTQDEASRKLDRSAALAFAAAMSSLLIATLVISQSARALEPDGAATGNSFEVGTISLTDDDEGRSLVNLSNMVPDRPAVECISVTYDGTILPVDVSLSARAIGGLTPHVTVGIDQGTTGGFGACDAFEPVGELYRGTIDGLVAASPLPVGSYRNQGDQLSFRFHFELADEAEAMGNAASVDFRWEVVPA